MMQTGCQQQHAADVQQQPSSPRGGGGMPSKLSLLQQLHHYGASAPAAHQPCHGFSIVGPLEPQQHLQAHFHHQSHMATAPNAFQNLLQQGFLLTASQQGYNLQLAAPQMPQGLVEDLIKLSPPGSPPMEGRVLAPAYSLVALLEQKTEQLQALVHSLSQGSQRNGGVVQPQAAMAAARMASNISQLAWATVGVSPPNAQQSAFVPPEMQPNHHFLGGVGLFQQGNMGPSCSSLPAVPAIRNPLPAVEQQEQHEQQQQQQQEDPGSSQQHAFSVENIQQQQQQLPRNGMEAEGEGSNPAPQQVVAMEDGDSGAGSRDEDDDGEAEDLTPGSYDLVEMNAVEILAEHTHFCDKCGKGFKRDANLRMHMRGHGEQYKSPAALARPDKFSQDPAVRPRRYSCPYVGCKRNKKHRKFQPLKTVLCVKNHYRRSHCPKSLTCSKCKSKKFSVMADLKTHEKHCGRDKWQCSCGTTFSRKDKLLGHIGLFQGHTPALPLHEMEGSVNGAPADDGPAGGGASVVGAASGSC